MQKKWVVGLFLQQESLASLFYIKNEQNRMNRILESKMEAECIQSECKFCLHDFMEKKNMLVNPYQVCLKFTTEQLMPIS